MANQSKKSSSGGKKSASSKTKKTTSAKGASAKKDAADIDFILNEILCIVLILFFIILFIGNYVPAMAVFGPLAGFLKRMFGIGSYFIPVLAIWFLVWEIRHKEKKYKTVKFAGIAVLFFGIIIFAHLLGGKTSGDFPKGWALFEGLYKAGAASNGGGVGGIIACALRDGLTTGIAVLISLIVIVIGLILFTGKSFFSAVAAFWGFLFASKDIEPKEKPVKASRKAPAVNDKQVTLEEAPKYKKAPEPEYDDTDSHYTQPPLVYTGEPKSFYSEDVPVIKDEPKSYYNEDAPVIKEKPRKSYYNEDVPVPKTVLKKASRSARTSADDFYSEPPAQYRDVPKKSYYSEDPRPYYGDEPPVKSKKPKMFNFIIGRTPDSAKEAEKAAEYFANKERELKTQGTDPLKKMAGPSERSKAVESPKKEIPLTFDLNKSALVDEDESNEFENTVSANTEDISETGAGTDIYEDIYVGASEDDEPFEDESYEEEPQAEPEKAPVKESFYKKGEEPLIDVPLESSEEAKSAGVIASAKTKEEPKKAEPLSRYVFPPIELLDKNKDTKDSVSREYMLETAKKLEDTLASFGVTAKVVQINRGPTVTRYEVSPGTGVKVSKIANLADDIALNLAASGVRIEAPIPGKAAVGIEIPNRKTTAVLLRDVLDTDDFRNASSKVSFGLGQDIAGNTIIPDISKMPHMLIAGATGSGKSVCINTIITSIIYKASPEEVKLILVDPKMVELSVYNGIPHLMLPVVTDPKKAAGALNWGVREMLMRYQRFLEKKVRDIDGYNNYLDEHPECMEEKMPRVVIIVDELADLMMVASSEVEDAIARLAQMARAAGLHLIIATQRPSVDVITGVIKANIPSRIAFSVSSGVDSRTIIDMVGAEKLIGKGDMLFSPMGLNKPLRVQGAFVSDREVENVVQFVKDNSAREVVYDEKIIEEINSSGKSLAAGDDDSDEFYEDAIELVVEKGKASASMLQRQFKIGYNRAARLIEDLESKGIVGPEEGSKPRKVLLTKEEYYNMKFNENDIDE